jgi:hypothetical protein
VRSTPFAARPRVPAALGILLITLAGCTSIHEGRFNFQEGWRKAQVLEVASVAEIEGPDYYGCIRAIPDHERGVQRFVVMQYVHMGKTKRHAQPWLPGQSWSRGNSVYVNLSSCDGQVVARRE